MVPLNLGGEGGRLLVGGARMARGPPRQHGLHCGGLSLSAQECQPEVSLRSGLLLSYSAEVQGHEAETQWSRPGPGSSRMRIFSRAKTSPAQPDYIPSENTKQQSYLHCGPTVLSESDVRSNWWVRPLNDQDADGDRSTKRPQHARSANTVPTCASPTVFATQYSNRLKSQVCRVS